MQAAANPIDVVEAAYQLDGTDREWLTRVGEVVRPLIEGGHGVTAYFYDLAIAAARRLRAAVAGSSGCAHDADAVLTPSGRVEDARGQARDVRALLREAVLDRERARSRMRRDAPERATEAWTALVSGQWSLVDAFERGGRRYIVARRNEHLLPDPRMLTPRERAVAHLAALGKSNKLIAYELGLAESTVGNHLSAAMCKLGSGSRVDLIGLLAPTTQHEVDKS